jgi:hypothetical protein
MQETSSKEHQAARLINHHSAKAAAPKVPTSFDIREERKVEPCIHRGKLVQRKRSQASVHAWLSTCRFG